MAKSNDFEAMAKNLINSPQGSKYSGDINKVASFLSNEEGKKLADKISAQSGEDLKRAAAAAGKGDKQAAINAVAKLLSTKEGAEFAQQVKNIVGKKK